MFHLGDVMNYYTAVSILEMHELELNTDSSTSAVVPSFKYCTVLVREAFCHKYTMMLHFFLLFVLTAAVDYRYIFL